MSRSSQERKKKDWKEGHSGGGANYGYMRKHVLFGEYRHLPEQKEWSRFPRPSAEE